MLKNITTSYKQYNGDLSWEEYNSTIQKYLKWMVDKLLDDGEILLAGIGKIVIVGRVQKPNPKNLRVDFVLTKKHGKTIYHLNEHTNGVIYSFRWRKQGYRLRYKHSYTLTIGKPVRRKLYQLIMKGKEYRIL